MVEGASYNNFLDGIEKSYCTYDGGDDPQGDRHYPDLQLGGYNGTETCGTLQPTYVISSSWSFAKDLPPHYIIRQCHEYMKLRLQGVTALYPSADYGEAFRENNCPMAYFLMPTCRCSRTGQEVL